MENIDYLILDVDGTLTDGKIYYSEKNDEIKAFNIKDGLVLAALVRLGLKIIVLTGRKSSIVERRMNELGITECYQGINNKKLFFYQYIAQNNIDVSRILYIGDDLNDLALMHEVKYKACPKDACEEIKNISDYISEYNGGEGSVRNILEHYMKDSDEWKLVVHCYE